MARYETFDWYEQALYYDMIFDVDTGDEADFLEAALAIHGTSGGRRVLEPACGSGRLVAELARRGYLVTGFDLSPGMLRFAKERLDREGLRARVVRKGMESFTYAPQFDLAHCLVSTFKYLMDEASARSHLERVARSLKPGGIYVLGLHLDDYDNTHKGRERWTARNNGTEVVCNIQGWPADRQTRKAKLRSRLIVTENGSVRRFETYWDFRTYSLRQLKSLLRSVPAFEHVATYDFYHDIDHPIDFDGEQTDNVLILRKSG